MKCLQYCSCLLPDHSHLIVLYDTCCLRYMLHCMLALATAVTALQFSLAYWKHSCAKCPVLLFRSMVHGVNGHSGHLVQNLVGAVPGDGIVSATAPHQLMEASPALELTDSRSTAPSPHVQSMESGKCCTLHWICRWMWIIGGMILMGRSRSAGRETCARVTVPQIHMN
jgi:hypothetical protein